MTRKKNKYGDESSVADLLQADILSERLRPGEWLKQSDLENRYDANRFEVRMALSALAARRLLDHIPNRGYRVINPSDRERADLYEVRTILETAAAKLVVQRAGEEDVAKLSEIVEDFEHAIENASIEELRRVNLEFHDVFYSICGNSLLAEQINDLRQRGLPGRRGGWDTIVGMRASNDDHRQMLEMLRKRDFDGMNYIIYRHLNRWREFTSPANEKNERLARAGDGSVKQGGVVSDA